MITPQRIAAFWLLFIAGLPQVVQAGERMFAEVDVSNLCETIKNTNSDRQGYYMDILIEKAGITKEQWNNHYAFEILCLGSVPIVYSLRYELEDFKALVDYGIDLSHRIRDDDSNVSTLKDYLHHQLKEGLEHELTDSNLDYIKRKYNKYRKVYAILLGKGAKGCAEQPELNCNTLYPLTPPHKDGTLSTDTFLLEVNDFIQFYSSDIDFDRPFKDESGHVTTAKDYVAHQYKVASSSFNISKRVHLRKIYKLLRQHGAKGCTEQPELHCTATYLKK